VLPPARRGAAAFLPGRSSGLKTEVAQAAAGLLGPGEGARGSDAASASGAD